MASIMEVARENDLEGLPEIIIKQSKILENFNKNRPQGKQVSSQWLGQKIKGMSIPHRTSKGRSEIILSFSKYWSFLEQYGLMGRDSTTGNENTTQSLSGQTRSSQGETGWVGMGRVSGDPWQVIDSPPPLSDENIVYHDEMEERAAILEYDGELSREEAERIAQESK